MIVCLAEKSGGKVESANDEVKIKSSNFEKTLLDHSIFYSIAHFC